MNQVLYRKWRPKTFSEVSGQGHITSVLRYEVEHGKTAHAYLFCGSRGTGKTTCAKLLAKAVNCENPQNGEPCGKCSICRGIDDGSIPDVVEMDAASNNSVEDIRQIRDEVVYSPATAKYRVYIIDEVHMLSQSAFNALLKTLEEPPDSVIFILATTELQKLPATIISRCRRFDFRRIALRDIADRLQFISQAENIAITNDAAILLARLAQGGMRDAVSMLELCASEGVEVDSARVRDIAGIAGRESCAKLALAALKNDSAAIFAIIGELYASSRDITAFWQELVSFYRDMIVVKSISGNTAEAYLDLTTEEYEDTRKCAANFTYETLAYHCSVLDEAYISMQRNVVSKRLCAEFALLRMAGKLDITPEALAARISALENAVPAYRPAPFESFESVEIKKSVQTDSNENAAPDVSQIENVVEASNESEAKEDKSESIVYRALPYWIEVVRKVEKNDSLIGSWLDKSQAYRAQGSRTVTVSLSHKLAKTMLDKPEIISALLGLISAYGPVDKIEFITSDDAANAKASFIDDIDDENAVIS